LRERRRMSWTNWSTRVPWSLRLKTLTVAITKLYIVIIIALKVMYLSYIRLCI